MDEPKPESYSGALLLASPVLKDPNFFHSVLLLAAHSVEDGAFGYILNRPLDKRVSDLISEEELGPLADIPVFLGGPVGTNKLSFASLKWDRKKGLLVQTHLSTAQARQALQKGREVRGFVGYSGWSEGQLENELQQKSWITCPTPGKSLMSREPAELWESILGHLGPYYSLLAQMPADLSLN